MFCPNCGRQIPDGSKFCPYCGASLEGKGINIPKSKSSKSIAKIVIPIILVIVILAGLSGIVKLIKHQQISAILPKITESHQNNAIWPMFHYNTQHTGRCPYDTSKNDGTLKWRYQTGYPIQSSPAIASDGTIYVGSDDHYLYAINPNGTLKWKYQTGNFVTPSPDIASSPAIASDGTIYVGSWDGYLYAIGSK